LTFFLENRPMNLENVRREVAGNPELLAKVEAPAASSEMSDSDIEQVVAGKGDTSNSRTSNNTTTNNRRTNVRGNNNRVRG